MFFQELHNLFKSHTKGEGFKNFIRLLTVDSLVKISGIILLPIYLQLMSPDDFGLFGYLTALVGYLATAVSGGLFVVQSKLYFEHRDRPQNVFYTLNSLLLIFVGLIFVVIVVFDVDQKLFFLFFRHPISFSEFRWPFLVGVLGSVFSFMLVNYYLASQQIKRLQLFNLLRIALIHVVAIILLMLLRSQNGALIRLASTSVIEVILLVCFGALLFKSSEKLTFNWAIAKRGFLLVYPIALYTVFSLVIFLSDRFCLERFGTRQDLAVYNLAWTLAGVIPFVSNSLHNIWMPQLLQEKSNAALLAKSKKMALKLIMGFSIVAVLIWSLTKFLLVFGVFRQEYNDVISVLPFVLCGVIFLSLFQLNFNYLVGISRFKVFMWVGVAVGLLSVIIAPFLVKKSGVMGASISMMAMNFSLLAGSLGFTIFYNLNRKINPDENRY